MSKKTLKLGMQFRDVKINREDIDQEKRLVTLSFSSEALIERWFGMEILDHSPKAVRLDRIKTGGPFLVDHSSREQVGVVNSCKIDSSTRKGTAVIKISRSACGEEIFQDILDGIRQNVSVGYRVHKLVLEEEKDEVATYRATDWEPYEISIVGIPADTSVGVGRSDGVGEFEVPVETSQRGAEKMTKQKEPENTATPAAPEQRATAVDVKAVQSEARQAEQNRVREILQLGTEHKCDALARKFIDDGKSVDECRDEILKTVYKAKPVETRSAEIGMNDQEVQNFSIMRAINALANPSNRGAQEAAAFEFECSQAQAKVLRKDAKGFYIPRDVSSRRTVEAGDQRYAHLERMIEALAKRDLVVGTATAGGHTVATELLAASFIDVLRNRMMTRRLGATILGGLVGDVAIPRQTGGATSYWVAESGAPTESQQAFDQVALTPKTVGAFTDISRKLLIQSSIDVEAFVRNDLATVLALAIDLAAINGSGASNQPEGILQTTGIGSVAGGANGLAPAWSHIVDLESAVANVNADVGSLAYLTNSKVRGKLKQVEKAANTAQFVWGDMQAEPGMGMVNGYRAAVSNQVPSNLTKGSGSALSAILFGNWADLIIGEWGAIDVLVDPYTGGAAGTVRVRVLQDIDIDVRHPESFAAMGDAITV